MFSFSMSFFIEGIKNVKRLITNLKLIGMVISAAIKNNVKRVGNQFILNLAA